MVTYQTLNLGPSEGEYSGSNPDGATFKDMNEQLKIKLQDSLKEIAKLDELVRSQHLENTQEFLNWQDKLNEISVK